MLLIPPNYDRKQTPSMDTREGCVALYSLEDSAALTLQFTGKRMTLKLKDKTLVLAGKIDVLPLIAVLVRDGDVAFGSQMLVVVEVGREGEKERKSVMGRKI